MTVTRRTLVRMATALAASSATVSESTAAQTPAPSTPSAAPSNDDLGTVRAQLQRNAQQLALVKLPMETEPAFHFKA